MSPIGLVNSAKEFLGVDTKGAGAIPSGVVWGYRRAVRCTNTGGAGVGVRVYPGVSQQVTGRAGRARQRGGQQRGRGESQCHGCVIVTPGVMVEAQRPGRRLDQADVGQLVKQPGIVR